MHTPSEITPIRLDRIRQCEHVKRAIEVAAVGQLSLTLCGVGRGMEYTQLLAEAARGYGIAVTVIRPCLCGNLGDLDQTCLCTPDRVARFCRRAGYQRALAADVYGDVPAPRLSGSVWTAEPDERVRERIAYAQSRPRPTQCDGASTRLLDAAIRQLQPTQMQVDRWLVVAGVIAQMAGTDRIGAAHLAEAIQYRPRRP